MWFWTLGKCGKFAKPHFCRLIELLESMYQNNSVFFNLVYVKVKGSRQIEGCSQGVYQTQRDAVYKSIKSEMTMSPWSRKPESHSLKHPTSFYSLTMLPSVPWHLWQHCRTSLQAPSRISQTSHQDPEDLNIREWTHPTQKIFPPTYIIDIMFTFFLSVWDAHIFWNWMITSSNGSWS